MLVPIKHPTTVLIAGPTGCGKTRFLLELIRNRAVQPPPQRIICVYGEWQADYVDLQRIAETIQAKLEFAHNPSAEELADLYDSLSSKTRNMMIIDDQMANKQIKSQQGNSITKLFTQGSHHRNLTVIYIVQNVFNQSSEMRNVNLNSHYLVLFKNPRDKTQAQILGQQMYPRNSKFLVDAYEDAIRDQYGYLLIDLHPTSDDDLRVRARIFDEKPIVYKPATPI
jgi:energy-coupling factor transporter ATP-binding protein EcfA2